MTMSKKMVNRMVYGIIILFCATPFLFLLYLNTTATMQSVSMVDLLQTTPVLTLQMLSIFLLPLAAYLLKLKWYKVGELDNLDSANTLYLSIVLLMIALFMLNNIVHGFLLLILLFFVTRHFSISFKKAFSLFKNPKFILTTFSGELFMLLVSLFVGLTLRRFI